MGPASIQQATFNQDCPLWGWMKWSFNGPMLVAHKPFVQMCLEVQEGQRDGQVGTARCSGTRQQQWHLTMHHARRTAQGDISFAISSTLHPDQCVTIDEGSEKGGMVLRNCSVPTVRQLFYLNRDWFQTAIASQAIVDSSKIGHPPQMTALPLEPPVIAPHHHSLTHEHAAKEPVVSFEPFDVTPEVEEPTADVTATV